jgi:hypothetical protein
LTQLKLVKRSGNGSFSQHHEVLLIRRIRELLYEEGFTISGARNRLDNMRVSENGRVENGQHEEPAGAEAAPARDGIDFASLKRELRAVLDSLQG